MAFCDARRRTEEVQREEGKRREDICRYVRGKRISGRGRALRGRRMEGEGQEEGLSVLLMGEKEERGGGGTSWDPSFFSRPGSPKFRKDKAVKCIHITL